VVDEVAHGTLTAAQTCTNLQHFLIIFQVILMQGKVSYFLQAELLQSWQRRNSKIFPLFLAHATFGLDDLRGVFQPMLL